MTFYDLHGKPIAYLDDDMETIYLFKGQPVAYLPGDGTVYRFNGNHIGWLDNGWIRDLAGYCVFFTEDARGSGPIKPVKKITPVKSVQHVKPVKHVKRVKSAKSANKLSWSKLSGEIFFLQ